MIDKDFLGYIEDALQQYREYHEQKDVKKLEFRDFLFLIIIWKLEEVLERLEEN